MNQRKETKAKVIANEQQKKKNRGITITTLIITIIIIILLAGITIGAISGDNGLINKATEARDLAEREDFKDKVEMQGLLTVAEAGRFDSDRFKERIYENLKDHNPTISEDDDSITVSDDRYDITLDKETGDVSGATDTKGIWPRVDVELQETDGTPYVKRENSEELVLDVNVTNEDALDGVEVKITVTDEDGETYEVEAEQGEDGHW